MRTVALRMHDRTNRALAAVAEIDARQLYLCPTCEGLLLTAVVGLPLPMVCDGDGELEAAIGGFFAASPRDPGGGLRAGLKS